MTNSVSILKIIISTVSLMIVDNYLCLFLLHGVDPGVSIKPDRYYVYCERY